MICTSCIYTGSHTVGNEFTFVLKLSYTLPSSQSNQTTLGMSFYLIYPYLFVDSQLISFYPYEILDHENDSTDTINLLPTDPYTSRDTYVYWSLRRGNIRVTVFSTHRTLILIQGDRVTRNVYSGILNR